jgi:hypothetical protein
MTLYDENHYDILEINVDASPADIRNAYLRVKAAYKKDSAALYTLMTDDDTTEMLHRIEEAYNVLSSPEKRREYDRSFGGKVISIDRVPPMDTNGGVDDLLVAPRTDFEGNPPGQSPGQNDPFFSETADSHKPVLDALDPVPSKPLPYTPVTVAPSTAMDEHQIMTLVSSETEWRGEFLKRIREIRRLSIEELSSMTRLTKAYISAIEEENFSKLPAPVFVRGFVSQICKVLKVPHERASVAYVARYEQAKAATEPEPKTVNDKRGRFW